jgi:hypothetical protein
VELALSAREEDEEIMKRVVMPPDRVILQDAAVNGQKVSYQGRMAVLWRARGDGFLEAFSGMDCGQITVNGKTTVFAEAPMPLVSWAPVPSQRQVPDGAKLSCSSRAPASRTPWPHPWGSPERPVPRDLFLEAGVPDSSRLTRRRWSITASRRRRDGDLCSVTLRPPLGEGYYGVSRPRQ